MVSNAAILEWQLVLGPDQVVTAASRLREAEQTTFATHQHIPAILLPETREQVQQCLRIATRHSIAVHPISTGKNWGYGSRLPVADGCVLLDLGRMKRIVGFNAELGYVTIEPGVTQRDLFAFLEQKRAPLWMDATGSSPDCSLIGNTLERGFGHTPYGDHTANVCGFEVVLPNGEVLETGFARYPNNQAASVYRNGLGPSIDGLFTQSNLGVVTRMTFWLMPAPECFNAFFFSCDRDDSLPAIIDALRPLRLDGTLRSAIHIGNDYKVLSGLRQYPWQETNGTTPLSPELMKQFRRTMKFGAWSGSGGLYGTRAQVAEARRLVKRALAGKVDKLQFLSDRLLQVATRFARPFGMITGWDLSKTLDLARPIFGLMKGIPTDKPMASVYWRKRNPPPAQADPDRDGCGLLWCAPVAPTGGAHAQKLASLTSEIVLRHGFEPTLSITLITERALICVISLAYDRDVEGEDRRARVCFDELQSTFAANGYMPYRLGIQSMGQMQLSGAYGDLLASIKRSVDPANVLAPGRYAPVALGEAIAEQETPARTTPTPAS